VDWIDWFHHLQTRAKNLEGLASSPAAIVGSHNSNHKNQPGIYNGAMIGTIFERNFGPRPSLPKTPRQVWWPKLVVGRTGIGFQPELTIKDSFTNKFLGISWNLLTIGFGQTLCRCLVGHLHHHSFIPFLILRRQGCPFISHLNSSTSTSIVLPNSQWCTRFLKTAIVSTKLASFEGLHWCTCSSGSSMAYHRVDPMSFPHQGFVTTSIQHRESMVCVVTHNQPPIHEDWAIVLVNPPTRACDSL
jgi:hypothetical protein